MQKWCATVLAGVVLVAGCSRSSAAARVQAGDVATMQVSINSPVATQRKSPGPLEANNPYDRPTLTKLVNLINAAQEVGAEPPAPHPTPRSLRAWVQWFKGYPPLSPRGGTDLVITRKNGQTAVLRPALDCTFKELPNGATETTCVSAKDELFYETSPGKPGVRLFSPELAKWLSRGGQGDLPPAT